MVNTLVSDEELEIAVQTYYDCAGNRSEAARALDIKRQTYNDRLRMAENRLGAKLGKIADGRIQTVERVERKLPRRGHIRRYICTSIQNNTHLHPGFKNLKAYCEWLDGLDNGSCELIIGTFSYQKAVYGLKAIKRGTYNKEDHADLWYSPEALPFICDHSIQLAPGLVWCGEQNILPTNTQPLTRMEIYNGRESNIVPHAQIAMRSVASMQDEATKFNYATGTMTQRNYVQKRAGIMAEQLHCYGAMLVEVNDNGNWWVRGLEVGADDTIMDIGPTGYVGICVQDGKVTQQTVTDSIIWGDLHAAEMEVWVRDLAWGEGGMLDTLKPQRQFMHDVFSMRYRSPHEERDFHSTYAKHSEEESSVLDEITLTADLLTETVRDNVDTLVVHSNHDRHLDRWLNEADFRRDMINAKYFCLLQYNVLNAMDEGNKDFNILEWALKETANCPKQIQFLGLDEGYVICTEHSGGIECGLHGDMGPDGARGTTGNLTKLGRAVTKGHDHKATIWGPVYSTGCCASSQSTPYAKGPSSWSVTHCVAYDNGCRALVTMWADRWRA